MHLAKHRRLTVRQRGDELILKPEPEVDIEAHLKKLWAKLPPVKGIKSDEELKQAIRDSVAVAWDEKRQRGESE